MSKISCPGRCDHWLDGYEQITETEALSRIGYWKAYYNDIGQLVKLEAYTQNKIDFHLEYQYHDNGMLKQYKDFNADGSVNVYEFDKKGRNIKSKL